MEEMYVGGTTPADEDCSQVGHDDYPERSRAEGRAFIGQIRRTFGEEPEGARLRIKAEQHDFGLYRSVVCEYDASKQAAVDYAVRVEAQTPVSWDDHARTELSGRQRNGHGD